MKYVKGETCGGATSVGPYAENTLFGRTSTEGAGEIMRLLWIRRDEKRRAGCAYCRTPHSQPGLETLCRRGIKRNFPSTLCKPRPDKSLGRFGILLPPSHHVAITDDV